MADDVTPVEAWIADVEKAAGDFARTRSVAAAVVQLTLNDRERVYVRGLKPGPTGTWIIINPYPEDTGDMVPPPQGQDEVVMPQTPRQILVHLGAVTKVELLTEMPEREFGFHVEGD